MSNISYYSIIVAGGSGKRMNSVIPKQFLEIHEKPILMHTLEKFHKSDYQSEIILVLANADILYWRELVKKHQFSIPHKIISGGTERFFSVKNAIESIQDLSKNSIIAIHDAVRPLITVKTINKAFETAKIFGNAIVAVSSKDSVRIVKNSNLSKAIDRSTVYLVQTPQVFNGEQLKIAYQQEYAKTFTDDASVVENVGFNINLIEGEHFNIKITYKEDILLAKSLLYKEY